MTKVTIENSMAVPVHQLVKDIELGTYFFGVIGKQPRNLYLKTWNCIISVSKPLDTWTVDNEFTIAGYQPVKEVVIITKA